MKIEPELTFEEVETILADWVSADLGRRFNTLRIVGTVSPGSGPLQFVVSHLPERDPPPPAPLPPATRWQKFVAACTFTPIDEYLAKREARRVAAEKHAAAKGLPEPSRIPPTPTTSQIDAISGENIDCGQYVSIDKGAAARAFFAKRGDLNVDLSGDLAR